MSFLQRGLSSAAASSSSSSSSSTLKSQYGIAPVISAKPPTDADKLASTQLEGVLRSLGLYESAECGERRESAIGSLNELLQGWMREEAREMGQVDATATEDLGKILTFGSFRLGVHGPGADMDTLVVGPNYISRQLFFDKFTKRLEQATEHVTELSVIDN